jgi:uncharacterized protein YgbK (DUF1537 family)
MSAVLPYPACLTDLPPVWAEDVLPEIQAALEANRAKVFILDDDPTGTQTVRDLPVVTEWSVSTLARQWADVRPGCFILTNSRALPAQATRALHAELAQNLQAAAAGRSFTLISRSDSTLRGHFPAETDALAAELGGFDLTVLAPYFKAGGRLTLHGEHYIAEADQMTPVAQTPFAEDPAFAFSTSFLPAYVEEKTAGRVAAGQVIRIDLETLRQGGPAAVAETLEAAKPGAVGVVDASDERDIQVFAAGALRAEANGKRILYRTAASFVAARVGQPLPPLLTKRELRARSRCGGLIVVGSYVPKTTRQLLELKGDPRVKAIELEVDQVLDDHTCSKHLESVASRLEEFLRAGQTTVVHTSRRHVAGADAEASLGIGQTISNALIALVKDLPVRPRFLLAKGGITSSDLATKALGVREAMVRGQILPGVPVWAMGEESLFPGLTYVVFPGNVGGDHALVEALDKLLG